MKLGHIYRSGNQDGGVSNLLFSPCNNAYGNDHSKDADEDQIALHSFTLQDCVEFFHNLKF
jgi:hypothetical protein